MSTSEIRAYELSVDPFDRPDVDVELFFSTLGDALDDDAGVTHRYVIVIDGEPPFAIARDIRSTTGGEPVDAMLDYIADDGSDASVELIHVRAIGRISR